MDEDVTSPSAPGAEPQEQPEPLAQALPQAAPPGEVEAPKGPGRPLAVKETATGILFTVLSTMIASSALGYQTSVEEHGFNTSAGSGSGEGCYNSLAWAPMFMVGMTCGGFLVFGSLAVIYAGVKKKSKPCLIVGLISLAASLASFLASAELTKL